jgi:Kef-type K+ transport system membrane component KefB
LSILLLLGLAVLLGLAGGKLLQWLRVPRVVGYIVVGVLLGSSLAGVIPLERVVSLAPLTDLALALIGFMVGGELRHSVFRRFGKKLVLIMLVEGVATFLLVTAVVTAFSGQLALGLLLGALSSATAPAATVDVLWEYKSRGPLTTTILGIVALDDALALMLFGFTLAVARGLLEGQPASLWTGLVDPVADIVGALALGAAAGLAVVRLLRWLGDRDDALVVLLGTILAVAGIADRLGISLILSEMAVGVALANRAPDASRRAFDLVRGTTPPIYIAFFVLVGARLQIDLLPQMGLLGVLYVGARTAGKMTGAWAGSTAVKAPPAVRKYLGFALFSQAGVAVGLALAVANEFQDAGPEAQAVGTMVVNVIAATTFLVQIIGPPMVKFAIARSGEIPRTASRPEPSVEVPAGGNA